MMNSECMLDRDYQGWVDFGRRDAEWAKNGGGGGGFLSV